MAPPQMTRRQRVLTALRRGKPDRVPKTVGFTPAVYERYQRYVAAELELDLTDAAQASRLPSPAEYFGTEVAGVGFAGPQERPDFRPYFAEELPEGTVFSEYGTAHVPGTFYHFERYRFPLASAASVADYEDYPWPDYTPDRRHAHLEDAVSGLHSAEWFVSGGVGHIFENAWQIRSMDRLFEDMVERPDMAASLLDRLTEDRAFQARRCAEAGADCLICGDDVGMQDRMMMSPAMWRRWFKPRWAHVWQVAKRANPDVLLWYHSDGYIEPIIPDLIEIGLEVLNPIQPECMDPADIKARYGDRLAFWGCVGTQTVMPFGSPADVRANIKWLIETVGEDGGLLLAPTHVLEPDVPWENVLTFFEAIEEYGRYS